MRACSFGPCVVLLAVLALMAPSSLVTAQEAVTLPTDLPPVVALARARAARGDENAGYQVELLVPAIQYEVMEQEIRRGKVAIIQDVKVDTRWRRIRLPFETPSQRPDSRIIGMDGEPLQPTDILARLRNRTPVLLSVTGRQVDPYYLQLVKQDSVMILLSDRDGAGDQSLLPRKTHAAGSQPDSS